MIEPLEQKPALIDQVHDRLVAAIADGTLRPGERMTQETVAARLGVSRQTVIHALQSLQRRGLLVESGRRGLEVAPLDARRLRDLYQVRAALDGLSARLAAERARAGALPVTVRGEATRIVAEGTAVAANGSTGDLIRADVAFHSIIHEMSGNSAIHETVAEEWPHFMRSMGMVLAEPDARVRVWSEHADILDCILAGKPSAAEQAARRHADRASAETARKLENYSSVA